MTLEIETNIPLRDLKAATLTVHRRTHHVTKAKDAKRLDEEGLPTIHYLEAASVNVIRESTKRRGKMSDAQFDSLKRRSERRKSTRWE